MKIQMKILAAALIATLAAFLSFSPAAFAIRTEATPPADTAQTLVRDALAALDIKDYALAEAKLTAATAAPDFAALSEPQRHAILQMLSAAAFYAGHNAVAFDAARKACAMPSVNGDDWQLRLFSAFSLDNREEMYASLMELATHWRDKLPEIRGGAMYHMVRNALQLPDGREKRLALMRALFAAGWKPPEPEMSADLLWFELSLALIEKGETAEAQRVAANITAPLQLIMMHADRRFDAIVAADRARFDVMKGMERTYDSVRAASAADPTRLALINEMAFELLFQNRSRDALALLDGALKRIRDSDKAFADMDQQHNWTLDYRSRALYALGRHDEALAQQRAAAAMQESRSPNVSNAINMGDVYVAMGRPQEALQAVTGVLAAKPSPYGLMQYYKVLACASAQTGDTKTMEDAMTYIRAHGRDAVRAVVGAELCAGNPDRAAAALIGWLEDSDTRADALLYMQKFMKPAHLGPFENQLRDKQDQIRARADVLAAVDKVGRVEAYALTLPGE